MLMDVATPTHVFYTAMEGSGALSIHCYDRDGYNSYEILLNKNWLGKLKPAKLIRGITVTNVGIKNRMTKSCICLLNIIAVFY